MSRKVKTKRKKSGQIKGYLYTFDLIYPNKTLAIEFEVMHSNVSKAYDAAEIEFAKWVDNQEKGATAYDYTYKTIRG